jgi:hypothetical protein
VPENVIAGLQRRQCDHAAAEVKMRVPVLGDTLRVTGNGAVNDGVGIALQTPVVWVEIGFPLGTRADARWRRGRL